MTIFVYISQKNICIGRYSIYLTNILPACIAIDSRINIYKREKKKLTYLKIHSCSEFIIMMAHTRTHKNKLIQIKKKFFFGTFFEPEQRIGTIINVEFSWISTFDAYGNKINITGSFIIFFLFICINVLKVGTLWYKIKYIITVYCH